MFKLTDKEAEIMELLWREDRALTRSEIIELSPNSLWRHSSLYLHLNYLHKVGAIEIDKWGQSYIYQAGISKADYLTMHITDYFHARATKETLGKILFSAIDYDDISDEILDELQMMLDKKRNKDKR